MRGEYSENKSSYFLSRIFLPMYLMKKRYPVLKKLPFLLPLMWIVRILSSLGNRKKYTEEAKNISSVDNGLKDSHMEFLKKHGL